MKPQKDDVREDGMRYDGRQWRTVGKQYHTDIKGYIFFGDKFRSLDSFIQQGGKIENIVHNVSNKAKEYGKMVRALYDAEKAGDVYLITNPAWPDWIKVGKAIDSQDRCANYQTGSPFRDFKVEAAITVEDRHKAEVEVHTLFTGNCKERRSEWFKIPVEKAKELLNEYSARSQ